MCIRDRFMTFYPVMLSIWGVLAVVVAALFLYRTSLTRDEDDQIYLDDAFQHEKAAQEAIIAKVNKIEPALRILSLIHISPPPPHRKRRSSPTPASTPRCISTYWRRPNRSSTWARAETSSPPSRRPRPSKNWQPALGPASLANPA